MVAGALRIAARTGPAASAGPRDLARFLIDEGLVAPHAMVAALAEAAHSRAPLADVLTAAGTIAPADLATARARCHGLTLVDPLAEPPDPRLIDRLGAARGLELGALPWRRAGDTVVVALDRPETFARIRDELTTALGPVAPALAEPEALRRALATARAGMLRARAEARVPPELSCRTWHAAAGRRWLMLLLPVLALLLVLAPGAVLLALTGWAVLTLVCSLALKGAALVLALRPVPVAAGPPPAIARRPVVSVLVPMFREPDIAPRLLRRLGRLDYPRALLDVLLVIEERDHETRAALENAALPGWMRVVVVPDGPMKTKPRALNYALDFCRGSIIGIYDAEDAPDRDQISRVVRRFHERGPEVGCLQGVLDYYNPRSNWIARCFTIEYAAWFRVAMPALQRLGLPLPLGGTTLFVRRAALEAVGAWDAHNVTEDADLGIRLARRGYRTEMLETATGEEACCRPRAWMRQRSRWIKGHMLTWAVHMRRPRALWRDLGPRGFLGYQVIFLGAQSQFVLAPLMLSFWLVAAGVWHPLAAVLPPAALTALVALFLTAEAVNIGLGMVGARRTRHHRLWHWAPGLHFYFPLAAVAAWRALWEIFTRPFYWAKTRHGLYDTVGAPPAPVQTPRTSPASSRSRVSNAREICVRSAAQAASPSPASMAATIASCSPSAAASRPSAASEVEASSAIDRCTRPSCWTR